MRLRLVAFCLIAVTVLGQQPNSSNALKQMSLEELSQIEVVSASKEPTSAFRSPVAIFVITNEDIRRSGAREIPEALRLAPGVEVARIDGSKWSIGIRGFGSRLSRSVLVLIDGRTVYTPLFAGTYWEVQDAVLEDIDRIEVIRGPGGTIWGPNAVDGVINIITKSTKDTKGLYATVGGGSEEQGFADLRYGGDNGKNLSYRVYAKAFTRSPEYHPGKDNFDDWRGLQAGFRLDWNKSDRDSITVSGDLYGQSAGERVGYSSYIPPVTKNIDGTADVAGGNILARWKRTLSEGNDIQIQAYYDRTAREEPNFGENRNNFDIDYLQRSRIPGRQEFLYGLEARVSPSRFFEVGSGLVFTPARNTDWLISGFFEDDVNLVNRKLLLTFGTKILRTNYAPTNFEPSIRLMWTPNDNHTVWASFTHALRTPSDAEDDFYISSYFGTASDGLPLYARYNANRQFAPEQLNSYEVGYRQLLVRNFYLDVATFYNHYHDLFSMDLVKGQSVETGLPFPDPTVVGPHDIIQAQFQNDFYGKTLGGEIAPEWRPNNFWRLRGSYSFLNMNLLKKPGSNPGNVPSTVTGASPRHEAGVESSFDLPGRLQLDLMYRYVSALPALGVRSYSTGDARLAWRFHPHMEFSVTGRNLFQPHHPESANDPGELVGIVRSVYASVAWR